MLFAIHPQAMNGDETVLNALDSILARIESEVHDMRIVEADQLEDSQWFKTSRQLRKKMLAEVAQASIYQSSRKRGPHLRRIKVNDAVSATCARNIANTPLSVLVENDFSDGALVEAAIRVLAGPKTVALCFGEASKLDPPAFQIESGGGQGELPKRLKKYLTEAAERERPPRLLVVADSDGEWQGDVKEHAVNIRAECAAANIPCPPLNKRSAENYIPDNIWRTCAAVRPDIKPAVDALLRLLPEQRDFVKINEKNEESWNKKTPKAAALFENVSNEDYNFLKQADLKGKSKGTKMTIFSLLDQHTVLTPAAIKARDHHDDLQAMVNQIEDEL